MPKTTAQLAGSKAGETAESNGFGSQERVLRPGGVYELKDKDGKVVDTLILKTHPKFGDGQAAAATRVGYEYVRPARKDEVKEIEVDTLQLATENNRGETNETMKGVLARLTAMEKENEELKASAKSQDESGSNDGDVQADAKEKAKDEAAKQLENRGQGNPALEDEEEDEDETSEKPLGQQNKDELRATAEAEGVELDEEKTHDTNAKIVDAIQASRDEKDNGNE